MKIIVLTISLLVLTGCRNTTDKEVEKIPIAIDSTRLSIKKENNLTKNANLISFLESPIDLLKFKKSKNRNQFTTGISQQMDYYFVPKIEDSIFYTYNYLTGQYPYLKRTCEIAMFKQGKNKHTYEDTTEILIELRAFGKDFDLEKANLVGQSKMELESKFGADYVSLGNAIAYRYKNKVLILELENSTVKSYRYIRLNTQRIELDLIKRIRKSKN